jgi:hypothetical protein
VFRNVFGDGGDPIENDPFRQFFAFGENFISGSVVSLADMNLDGRAEVVVGNVGGMRSTVNVFDVSDAPEIIQSYFPFGSEMRGGVSIAVGKITNDDVPDLIVGAGYRGQSGVEVIDGDSGDLLDSFTAYDSNAPVRVAAVGDQIERIVTAQGPNGDTNEIRSFDVIVDNGGVIVVPDPSATLNLNDLGDPRLFGAYYLDVLDLFALPNMPNGSDPIDETPEDTETELEREGGGVLGIGAAIDSVNRLPGDSNGDGVFDSSDLVTVFAAGEYEDDISSNSTFETGDWDRDGEFTSSDLVFVFRYGSYGGPATGRSLVSDVDLAVAGNDSLDLLARDRLFSQDDDLWALRELLEDDDRRN